MNICHCGTQVGYPHTPECPFPLYHNNGEMVDKWREEWFKNRQTAATKKQKEEPPC